VMPAVVVAENLGFRPECPSECRPRGNMVEPQSAAWLGVGEGRMRSSYTMCYWSVGLRWRSLGIPCPVLSGGYPRPGQVRVRSLSSTVGVIFREMAIKPGEEECRFRVPEPAGGVRRNSEGLMWGFVRHDRWSSALGGIRR
jgi:hypothetical protein